jgi:predicted  nucleic acid-binding Zn-ribbon protein
MGTTIAALLQLQSVEKQLTEVRNRLRTRKNAVAVQQRRIDQLKSESDALQEKSMNRRKDADRLELDLKVKEAAVSKYRGVLNTAKTNKEYATILTQINTSKADNAKVEEEALKIIQEVDGLKADREKIDAQMAAENARLAEVRKTSDSEIARLEKMQAELDARRAEAVKTVPKEALVIFERVAPTFDGEAMAVIEVQGRKPPFDYICGGCYMSLNAEHVNMLSTRDDIRRCDNCGRILYMESAAAAEMTNQ